MTFLRPIMPAAGLLPLLLSLALPAQTKIANQSQQFLFAGLRSTDAQGSIKAMAIDADGDIYLLFDQGDGVRVLKVANDGTSILAQVKLGAKGDSGVAMTLDLSGNLYVTGTSTSSSVQSTTGAAITASTPNTTNSFVAKFDASLNEQFLTFTGGTRIAASAIAASVDRVFVTGITFATDLPVTQNGIQQGPAYGSVENGFVEAFSADGTTLNYATYLTGALGDTTPNGIAVDAGDDAWIVGGTSAAGFATVNAIVPDMLSNPSGFLLRLTPAGDGIVFSTFVPGVGLSSVALDSTGDVLLISGAVALGQFPVDTASSPLVPTTYQVLLQMPLDGSSVTSGTVIAPAEQSVVLSASGGAAWVGGSFAPGAAPLLPQTAISSIGSGYAVRVTPGSEVDESIRLGGIANQQQTYASMALQINSLAVDAAGELLATGAAQPTASSSLLTTETYDLPLLGGPTPAFPSAVSDTKVTTTNCEGSLCAGSAGYLAKLGFETSAPSLVFSLDDLPFVTLRNLGSTAATGLSVTTTAGALTTNCGSMLSSGGVCNLLLLGGTSGSISVSASNAPTATGAYPAYSTQAPASTIVFYPKELDFGIQTSASATAVQVITVTNLGSTSQTFTEGIPSTQGITSLFSEAASDCAVSPTGAAKILAAGATCHINVAFAASASASNDGFITGAWSIGSEQLMLTGYSQAATLNVSATEIDFGTEIQQGIVSSRYLFLSNASDKAILHASASLPSNSPFVVTDGCASTLSPKSICRIRINYLSATAPSTDSISLTLDEGLSVLLTGEMKPPPDAGGSSVNPSLTLSAANITFGDSVVVTGVSSATQTVGITNSGDSDFNLAVALTGDFVDTTSCGTTLAAGATCAVAIRFAPSLPSSRRGLLSVTAGSGTAAATVSLSGTGVGLLAANNGSLAFGGIPVSQPLVQFYKVLQPFYSLAVSTIGPYEVALIEDNGYGHGEPPPSLFSTSAEGSCHNCWVGVRLTPTALGSLPGSLTFSSDPKGLPYTVGLFGSGIATTGLILSPTVEEFGSVPVNSTSGAVQFLLTNESVSGVSVNLSTPAFSGDFAKTSVAGSGPACGGTLAFGATCFVSVSFAPTTNGSQTGSLALSADDGSSATAALVGLGTADPGVAISPLAITFAYPVTTLSANQTVTITNTGLSAISISQPSTTTSSFHILSGCTTLGPQASCPIQVGFIPGNAPLDDTMTIPIISNGSAGTPVLHSYRVALTGMFTAAGAGLQIQPSAVTFGPIASGTASPTRVFTVTNLTTSDMALSISIPRNYALVGDPCTSVQANANCSFQLEFVPLEAGDTTGTIAISGSPADGSAARSAVAYSEGYGVGNGSVIITGGLIVDEVYRFGQVASGESKGQIFTVASNSDNAITVRRVTSAPPFLSTTNCGNALTTGANCTITVTYSPQNTTLGNIADAGPLTIESDAGSSPDVLELTGQSSSATNADAATLNTFSLSQGSLTFPAVIVGDRSPTQTLTLTNPGNTSMHVSSVTASPDFTVSDGCTTVAAGATCTITVASSPQTAGTRLASLEIASDATNSLEFVTLIGAGIPSALTLTPTTVAFGSVQLGSSAVLPVEVTNSGSVAIAFQNVSATGNFSAAGNCPASGTALPPQSSCTIQVIFAPLQTGSLTGSLMLMTSASSAPLMVSLSGTGTASELTVVPGSVAFGDIVVGSSEEMPLMLNNRGTAAVTSLSLMTTGDFAVTAGCPNTLAIAASCIAQVTFTPKSTGLRSGTLTITSSDLSSPLAVPLSGTGIANGDFVLTVNNAATASATVKSGGGVTFNLLVTPTVSFSGDVALTCTPVQTVVYATCSLLFSNLPLASGAQTSTATINTVSSATAMGIVSPWRENGNRKFLALSLSAVLVSCGSVRRARRKLRQQTLFAGLIVLLLAGGCGGGSGNFHYTPPGTYQFQVTASSTSGTQIIKNVSVTVIVTPR